MEIGCKKILCTGTCWEYGRTNGMLNEDMQPIINNPFTAAKNSLHIMGKGISKEHGISFIWTSWCCSLELSHSNPCCTGPCYRSNWGNHASNFFNF